MGDLKGREEQRAPALEAGISDRLAGRLGYESVRTSETTASSWIELQDGLLDSEGRLQAVPLAYLIDSTPGVVCGAAARPDWVVTTDLQASFFDTSLQGRPRADASLVRASRVGVLGKVVVVDEGDEDRVVAAGSVNHARVPLTSSLDVPDMGVGVHFHSRTAQEVGAQSDLREALVFGAGPADTDLQFEVCPLGVNPLGIVHGSVTTALAMSAARHRAGVDWPVSDIIARFCGSIRQGPAVARADIVAGDERTCLVQVDIRDEAYPQRSANLSWVRLLRPA